MARGGVSRLLVAALLGGCAQASVVPPPEPGAEPLAAVAELVRAPAPISLAERIRQEGWMVRFWEQLTAAQRRRVTTRLRQSWPTVRLDEPDVAPIWDSLGLPEREALIFGNGLPRAGAQP